MTDPIDSSTNVGSVSQNNSDQSFQEATQQPPPPDEKTDLDKDAKPDINSGTNGASTGTGSTGTGSTGTGSTGTGSTGTGSTGTGSTGTGSATTLLTDDPTANPNNCLNQALGGAHQGDNLVFLDEGQGSGQPGHVVVQDAQTGAITDPTKTGSTGSASSLSDYLDTVNSTGGHSFTTTATVSAAEVKDVLNQKPEDRADYIAGHASDLTGIENREYAGNGSLATGTLSGSSGTVSSQDLNTIDTFSIHKSFSATSFEDVPPPDENFSTTDDAKIWKGLGLSDQDAKELERPLAALNILSMSTDKGQQQAALNYIQNNSALMNALDIGGSTGKADGKFGTDDVDSLIGKLSDARDAAIKNMPKVADGSDVAKTLTTQAAVLAANAPLLDVAGPAHNKGAASQAQGGSTFGKVDLQAISADGSNTGLSAILKGGAALFAQPGMLNLLDTAGSQLTKPDGLVSSGDIQTWLQKLAPKNDVDATVALQTAADFQTTAGVDVSKLGEDIIKNPDKYGPEQRAAVIQQLIAAKVQIDTGLSQNLFDVSDVDQINPMDTAGAQNADLQITKNIQALNAAGRPQKEGDEDKSVGYYLAQHEPDSLKSIINGDPALAAAIKSDSYGSVHNNLTAKDDSGKGFSVPDALANLESQMLIKRGLAYTGGPSGIPQLTDDISSLVNASPADKTTIVNYYNANVVSGSDVTSFLQNNPNDWGTALGQFALEKANFDAAIGPNLVKATADASNDGLLNTFNQFEAKSFTTPGLSGIEDALGVPRTQGTDGNDDASVANLAKFIMDNSAKITDDGNAKDAASINEVTSLIRSVIGTGRSSAALLETLGHQNASYTNGTWHAVAAAAGAAAMVAQAIAAGKSTGAQETSNIGQTVGYALWSAGMLVNSQLRSAQVSGGDVHFSQSTADWLNSHGYVESPVDIFGNKVSGMSDLTASTYIPRSVLLRQLQVVGSGIAGVGGGVASAFAFVGANDAFHSGNIPLALADISTGVAGGVSAVATLGQAAASFLSPFAKEGATSGLARAASLMNASGLGLGLASIVEVGNVVATFASLIASCIPAFEEAARNGNKPAYLRASLYPTLDQYGIDYTQPISTPTTTTSTSTGGAVDNPNSDNYNPVTDEHLYL